MNIFSVNRESNVGVRLVRNMQCEVIPKKTNKKEWANKGLTLNDDMKK